MLRIGHRGAAGHEPENTLRSFLRALEVGVDMIEMDVLLCSSGELIVMHDETVDRTTNGKGALRHLSLKELQRLDAGKGERVPTLDEALDLLRGKCMVNIELKGEGTGTAVARAIKRHVRRGWRRQDFLISAFTHKELRKFRELERRARVGILASWLPHDWKKRAVELDAWSLHLNQNWVGARAVRLIHQQGLKLLAYTANREREVTRLKLLGVDGIFSDFPERL